MFKFDASMVLLNSFVEKLARVAARPARVTGTETLNERLSLWVDIRELGRKLVNMK